MATESLPGSVDSPVESLANHLRRLRAPVGLSLVVVGLVASGWLSSAVYPDSDFASLATGIAWSLAWLLALVVVVYAASRLRHALAREIR